MILLKSDEICSLLWRSAVLENPTNMLGVKQNKGANRGRVILNQKECFSHRFIATRKP